MTNPETTSINRRAGAHSRLWRALHRLYHHLRHLPAQLKAAWNNQPTIEISNELGRFTALPLTGTVAETDPTYQAHLHSWVTDAPGGIFVDAGAGSGFFTRLATTYGAARQAYAFEPNPSLYALLLKNIADNQLSAEGFNAALAREVGQLNLAPHSVKTGYTSSCSGRSSIHVRTFPLDSFLGSQDVSAQAISLIRVASEGHELAALAGMRATLQEMQPGSRLILRLWNDSAASDTTFAFLKWSGFHQIDNKGDNYLFEKTITPDPTQPELENRRN